jgi:hypothetical protein
LHTLLVGIDFASIGDAVHRNRRPIPAARTWRRETVTRSN